MAMSDVFACLLYKIMKFDPQIPWGCTSSTDILVLTDGRLTLLLWIALRELRAKGICDPQIRFCNPKSTLEARPTFRNLWTRSCCSESNTSFGVAAGIALAKKKTGNPAKVFCVMDQRGMEVGYTWEIATLSTECKLENFIVVMNYYNIAKDNFIQKWESFGWDTQCVDGHEMTDIFLALRSVSSDTISIHSRQLQDVFRAIVNCSNPIVWEELDISEESRNVLNKNRRLVSLLRHFCEKKTIDVCRTFTLFVDYLKNKMNCDKPKIVFCKTVLGKGCKSFENNSQRDFIDVFHQLFQSEADLGSRMNHLKEAKDGFRAKIKARVYSCSETIDPSLVNRRLKLQMNDKISSYESSTIVETFSLVAAENDERFFLCEKLQTCSTNYSAKYPKQYLCIDSYEPVGICVGVASEGFRPLLVFEASELGRSVDQLKEFAYSSFSRGIGMVLVGQNPGLQNSMLGLSALALDDFAITRTIFGSSIFIPCDNISYWQILLCAWNTGGMSYIRGNDCNLPPIYSGSETFQVGGLHIVYSTQKFLHKVTICAVGLSVHEAIKAAKYSEETFGFGCCVVDVYCLKPIASFELKKLYAMCGKVITVESHATWGGLYTCISEHIPVSKALAVSSPPFNQSSYQSAIKESGIDQKAIVRGIMEICEKQ
jgi:transketolase C-terminal domain/subunit/transketolase N-terminal domain/subunit